ncbi:unnamed protein product, partial [Porites evermanni]
ATEWLEWKAHEGGIFIRHQMNNTEKRVGERKIPVDGFHGPSQTVFHFHGCWWHGHICHLAKGKEMNEKRKRPMVELLEETKETSKYIKAQEYNLVEIYECQWRRIKKTNSQVQQFLNSRFNRLLDHHKTLTQDQILSAIRSESLFGVVECDYTPFPCFQPFGEAVSDARRAGDVDPNKAIIADTMKLVGNSRYGKTITDRERHQEVQFVEETKASRLINKPFFR